eukprot:TRINITY_DN30949_c0_g1_i1.p1 TRINITY_DN30949_c0_g1~~TRINITY_DN30949_c0_g1_i1.p1  ORF type:complete len:129 (+),score=20.05 TRINITY_DN30949_c0_g1_i1:89-475(+)
MLRSLVGSEMCIRDRLGGRGGREPGASARCPCWGATPLQLLPGDLSQARTPVTTTQACGRQVHHHKHERTGAHHAQAGHTRSVNLKQTQAGNPIPPANGPQLWPAAFSWVGSSFARFLPGTAPGPRDD